MNFQFGDVPLARDERAALWRYEPLQEATEKGIDGREA